MFNRSTRLFLNSSNAVAACLDSVMISKRSLAFLAASVLILTSGAADDFFFGVEDDVFILVLVFADEEFYDSMN